MDSYCCPGCGRQDYLFGKEKGRKLADTFKIPFLGGIPLDGEFSESADQGVPIVFRRPESLSSLAMLKIADEVLDRLPPKPKAVVKDHPWEEGRDHHKKKTAG
jgi:ATP-binding protein involved in chromosome partitioning